MRKSAPLKELRKPQKHKIRDAVKQRFGGACAFCGCIPRILTLDHVVAKSKGGLDVKWNLAAVCQRCNRHKGSRPLWEWWQTSPHWDEERAAQFAATVLVCQI
jgi:5-methylcytosine-specific restriction endonuclease McrA